MRTASCHRMRMEKCTRLRVPFSVEGLLTTGICPLTCAGLATILTMRLVGHTGSSATGYGTLPSSGWPAWARSVSRRRRPWVSRSWTA